MATTMVTAPPTGATAEKPGKQRWSRFWADHGFQLVVLVPTLVMVGIFVYGFIGYSIRVSLSQWTGITPNLAVKEPVGSTYSDLLSSARFQTDLRNIIIFTVLFLTLAVAIGLGLALLVHNAIAARPVFRSIFLFPYALSFIVTGVVWRWVFTPSAGANLILQALGIDAKPKWITDP